MPSNPNRPRVTVRPDRPFTAETIVEIGAGERGAGCLVSIYYDAEADTIIIEPYRASRVKVRVESAGARERALREAAERAIPWLVLLGDHIGNGTTADPTGWCDAIIALRNALKAPSTSDDYEVTP